MQTWEKYQKTFEEGQRLMSIETENLFPPLLALLMAYLNDEQKCLGETVVT